MSIQCPECGGMLKTNIQEGTGSNRTENRLVGGRNMKTVRQCVKCGKTFSQKELL